MGFYPLWSEAELRQRRERQNQPEQNHQRPKKVKREASKQSKQIIAENTYLWPAYVTEGPLTKRGLTVKVFHSREAANDAGYHWVGLSRES